MKATGSTRMKGICCASTMRIVLIEPASSTTVAMDRIIGTS